jgi:23S rRNA pseudouridine2605 synthase
MSQEGERIQKVLARAGFGSRRGCEELIRQGRVVVNGEMAKLGQRIEPKRDRITVDGRLVQTDYTLNYVALNKPKGVLSAARDDTGRHRTVCDLVSLPGRLYPVGRLDLDSEGLILLTNDGELANFLTHPRYEHTKEYFVDVEGHPEEEALERWRRGIYLDDQRTAPAEVSILSHKKNYTRLRVVLREGRKRQIRRVAEKLGHPVRKLVRVRIGPIQLGNLKPGQWRPLSKGELVQLQNLRQQRKKPSTRKRRPH